MDMDVTRNQGGCDMNGIWQDNNLMMLRVYGSNFTSGQNERRSQTSGKPSTDNTQKPDFTEMFNDMIAGLSVAM